MKTSLAILALAASVFAIPQAVTEAISPKGDAPDGCEASYDGQFEVTIFRLSSKEKRDLIEKRSCSGEGVLSMILKDGVLKDAKDRTGYIASNFQLQFDGPPQAGAIYTAGFSACSNHSLALGSSTVFYQCLSGDFYNLYDRSWAEQCEPIEIYILPCGSDSDTTTRVATNKRVVGSSIVATTEVTVVSDGKTKVVPTTIAVPMCQIGDGQVQVRTTPCDDMTIPVVTVHPVSQISDGQIQVPTQAPAVSVLPSEIPNTLAASAGTVVVASSEEVLQTATGSASIAVSKSAASSRTSTIVTSASVSSTTSENVPKESAPATTTAVVSNQSSKLIPGLAAAFMGLFGVALCL